MRQNLAHIALVVDDYDSAINYYTKVLNFDLLEDTTLSPDKRWVLIGLPGSNGCSILLAKASNDAQKSHIGNQTGGRVFLFIHTDNFDRDHKNLLNHNVKIVREPVKENWGNVLVFADIYGNLWDLIEPA
jgi:catechol 2,3-dioxygenase-like lactoylglutathione lyase family enzyme